jgi:hypothetical protein
MSKQIVEGKIDKLFVKDFGEQDDYGNQYGLSMNINGQWFGLGKKKKPAANIKDGSNWHQLAEGDVIEAVSQSVERNGRTYNNVRSSDITLKESGNGGGNSSAGAGAGNAVRPTQQVNSAGGGDRQDAIMRQSAMNYAAQIIAGTLTSKSDLDQAASDVVRIANEYFLPYAQHGVTEDETRKAEEQELKNQQAAQAADDEQFNDDIPF